MFSASTVNTKVMSANYDFCIRSSGTVTRWVEIRRWKTMTAHGRDQVHELIKLAIITTATLHPVPISCTIQTSLVVISIQEIQNPSSINWKSPMKMTPLIAALVLNYG